ncbi:MAG: helix-turn-helix transcriptional regulator [Ardenticatenaceae bacterium]|nr:helix-turn-helix transcriptional regulator [Ardenticatenaceae bacterium]
MASQAKVRSEPVYVISVAAKLVNLHPQTLRHYERIGLITPARSEGNVRLYSDHDIEQLRKIVRLTDDLGVNLAGVEVILNMAEQIEELQEQMGRVEAELRAEIERVRRRGPRRLEETTSSRPRLPAGPR